METNGKEIAPVQKRPLPKLDDLYADVELASKFNDLNKVTNARPKAEWIRFHPLAKKTVTINGQKQDVPIEYLPVERVEYLLTSIYTKWRKEIKSVQVIANSIVVTMRLWVLDPITGEWDWQEGVGAAPIRVNKGAKATDFGEVQSSSVQTGAPAAESYALKDAAEGFGKIFGKDLNRKDEINYEPMQESKFTNSKNDIPDELKMVIEFADDIPRLTELFNANKEFHSNPEFMRILTARKAEIKKELQHGSPVA